MRKTTKKRAAKAKPRARRMSNAEPVLELRAANADAKQARKDLERMKAECNTLGAAAARLQEATTRNRRALSQIAQHFGVVNGEPEQIAKDVSNRVFELKAEFFRLAQFWAITEREPGKIVDAVIAGAANLATQASATTEDAVREVTNPDTVIYGAMVDALIGTEPEPRERGTAPGALTREVPR